VEQHNMSLAETIDTEAISTTEAMKLLHICFAAKRPLFIWGPPGIGKSEIVDQITHSLKGYMIDMRMALMAPDEIRGIPFYNKDAGEMSWAPPEDLPLTGKMLEQINKAGELICMEAEKWPHITLFLDEMNSAPPAVQAAGYQLVLNRRIGNFVLPDNVVIVAAGNRESDRGVTYRMPSPLANRFSHIELTHDFDSWFEWAITDQVHPDVIGYLSCNKASLFDFDPKTSGRAFASPRSWVALGELLHHENPGEPFGINPLIGGTVGPVGVDFIAHRTYAKDLPTADDILSGKATTMNGNSEMSAMHSLSINLCFELKERFDKLGLVDEWHIQADRCFIFMMDNFNTELIVMGAKVALTNYKLPLTPGKLKCFDRFHKDYGRFIVAAVGA